MTPKPVLLNTFIIVFAVLISACAPDQQPSIQTFEATTPEPDWIVVENNVWLPVIDPLSEHLNSAYVHLKEDQILTAGIELRRAADFLQQEMEEVDGEEKTALQDASQALNTLSARLMNGELSDAAELASVYAGAYDAHVGQAWKQVSWQDFIGLPDYYFHLAQQARAAGNPTQAATQLRKAAAFMRLKTTRAAGRARGAMIGSMQSVLRLADQLEQGKTVSKGELARVVGHANHVLAYHHRQLSGLELKSENRDSASAELTAANIHVVHGMIWASMEEDDHEETAVAPSDEPGPLLLDTP